ncbi:MAG: cell division protein ZapA [Paludibacteraceae bacterium]|nr:cell division protein ZapA [Paludibacteraceae bacterium]
MSERKQNITLKLDIHTITLSVDPDKEEFYRLAGAWLNKRYQLYQAAYRNDSPEKLWLKVALEAAVGLHADARQKALEPIEQKIQELNKIILQKLNSYQ